MLGENRVNTAILYNFLCFTTASFEVTVNGKLIFSKLEQGSFPSFKEVGLDLKYNTAKPVLSRHPLDSE